MCVGVMCVWSEVMCVWSEVMCVWSDVCVCVVENHSSQSFYRPRLPKNPPTLGTLEDIRAMR